MFPKCGHSRAGGVTHQPTSVPRSAEFLSPPHEGGPAAGTPGHVASRPPAGRGHSPGARADHRPTRWECGERAGLGTRASHGARRPGHHTGGLGANGQSVSGSGCAVESGALVHGPTPCDDEEAAGVTAVLRSPSRGSPRSVPQTPARRETGFPAELPEHCPPGTATRLRSPRVASEAASFRAEQTLLFDNCISLSQLSLFKEEY